MPPEEVDIHIEDGEGFQGGMNAGISIKQIVLEQFRKCAAEGSKEMTRGGMTNRVVNGKLVSLEIPNQREIFKNSVKMLEGLLYPEISKNEKVQAKIKVNDEEIEKKRNEYDKVISGLREQKAKEAPQALKGPNSKSIDLERTAYNVKEELEFDLLDIYTKRFIILSGLLNELNYLEESGAGN